MEEIGTDHFIRCRFCTSEVGGKLYLRDHGQSIPFTIRNYAYVDEFKGKL